MLALKFSLQIAPCDPHVDFPKSPRILNGALVALVGHRVTDRHIGGDRAALGQRAHTHRHPYAHTTPTPGRGSAMQNAGTRRASGGATTTTARHNPASDKPDICPHTGSHHVVGTLQSGPQRQRRANVARRRPHPETDLRWPRFFPGLRTYCGGQPAIFQRFSGFEKPVALHE